MVCFGALEYIRIIFDFKSYTTRTTKTAESMLIR